jgi:PAS domain S-box-containing protein
MDAVLIPGYVDLRGEPERESAASTALLISDVCAGALIVLALMVLAGWALDDDHLVSIVPGHVSMKVNTALGFLVAGLGLIARRTSFSWSQKAAQVGAVIMLGIGMATLAEYVFGTDLHIDETVFPDLVSPLYPGRMAHLTAINFCLAGVSLSLFRGRGGRRVARAAALAVVGIAFAAMVGSLYGVEMFYGSMVYTSMALHTGAGFLLLGLGLVLQDTEWPLVDLMCAPEQGGVVLRRSLPWVVAVPVLLGWLYLNPTLNFREPKLGMALFAATLVGMALVAMWWSAGFLVHSERQREAYVQLREESAAAIRRNERELRLVTDQLPMLLSYIDAEGCYVRVNRTYENWTGRPMKEIVGKSILELLGRGFWERTRDARQRALGGEMVTFETVYPTLRGDRPVQITYAPDVEESGEVRGLVCMVVDRHPVEKAMPAEAAEASVARCN